MPAESDDRLTLPAHYATTELFARLRVCERLRYTLHELDELDAGMLAHLIAYDVLRRQEESRDRSHGLHL